MFKPKSDQASVPTSEPSPKSMQDLEKELEDINKTISAQRSSLAIRGIVPPYMSQKILDYYILQRADIVNQIEALKTDNSWIVN